MLVTQIYTAGTETTSTALQWALLYMCLHPEVKEKVHEEIDKQVGNRKYLIFLQHAFSWCVDILC